MKTDLPHGPGTSKRRIPVHSKIFCYSIATRIKTTICCYPGATSENETFLTALIIFPDSNDENRCSYI